MASEDGWEPFPASADQCVWITVPGTGVSLQLLQGQPSIIMRAFAADFNAYIEPLRDPDSAGWTPTNSVPTSNHLNGTAMDLNWNSHPFQTRGTFTADQMTVVRELLAFYANTIYWGGDWTDPVDEMHWQMDYDTYGSVITANFIAQFIRADGFSTFRRGNAPIAGPQPQLSGSDEYAEKIIAEGQRRGITPRGIEIALATGLVESNLQVYANEKVPDSMNIPHDAVGSDGYSVGIFQQQVVGPPWWWGDAATCMDPTSSAGLFYDRLVKLDYNGPNSPGSYAQAVQDSAYPDRYDQRFNDAVALYNRLVATTSSGDDELSAEDSATIAAMAAQLDKLCTEYTPDRRAPSRSFFAEDQIWGETPLGFLWNVDGNMNELYMTLGYLMGVTSIEDDVERVANGVAPASWAGSQLDATGKRWLAEVGQQWCQGLISLRAAMQTSFTNSGVPVATPAVAPVTPAPQVVYLPAPAVSSAPSTTGQVLGNAYDSLAALLATDALGDSEKSALTALISVIQTKIQGA